MSTIKSLWASVQGDPVFMRRVNGWLTIFWIAMIPFSIAFGLLSSVAYVSALSLWALVSGHWSAWQAARVEVQQQADARALEESPVEERVVDKIVEETEVNRTASVSANPQAAPTDGAAASTQGSEVFAGTPVTSSADELRCQLATISQQLSALQTQIGNQHVRTTSLSARND